LANITDNFKPGETYNLGSTHHHSIEELSNIVLKVTGASPSLAQYRDAEGFTTHHKVVDVSKASRDLSHRDTYSLEEGLRITADWMRRVYNLPNHIAAGSSLGYPQ